MPPAAASVMGRLLGVPSAKDFPERFSDEMVTGLESRLVMVTLAEAEPPTETVPKLILPGET